MASNLSVVVASIEGKHQERRFLEALHSQSGMEAVEIIVVDRSEAASGVNTDDMVRIHLRKEASLPELWGAGIRQAKGEWIAIMETTCPVASGWLNAVTIARHEGMQIFGGAVEMAPGAGWVAKAAYLCEYGQFMHPIVAGPTGELPGNNICFHRTLLQKASRFTNNGFWKTYWCMELKKEDVQLFCVPEMTVTFEKDYKPGYFVVRRFHHGRCFGGMRNAQLGVIQRLCFAAGTFLLPFLFLYRIGRSLSTKGRMEYFVSSFPGIVLAVVAWSLGELTGYLCGCGKSCERVV